MSSPDTSSQNRDKWLRRLLPALSVLVVYFVFIAPRINAVSAKADADILRMKNAYMANQTKLSELTKQKNDLLKELAALRKKGSQTDEQTVRDVGFIARPDYANEAIARLSEVLTEHGLHIIEDGKLEWGSAKDSIPKTVSELAEPLGTKAATGAASLWRVRFSGGYLDVYWALHELSRGGLLIVPVSLDMVPPAQGEGAMEWSLTIWV